MEKVLVILGSQDQKEDLLKEIKKQKVDIDASFYEVKDWNKELSPWIFNEFGEGARFTLENIQSLYNLEEYYLIGYSLAGLFCLWVATKTKVKGIGCCSGSLWFENFVEYVSQSEIDTSKIYLSLGKKEKKTRNVLMSTIEEKYNEVYSILLEKGIETTFVLENGNHFYEVYPRLVRSMKWLITK